MRVFHMFNIVVTPMFPPDCKYYYYCEQDYGHICHVNVGKTMNLAIEGNAYILLLNKRKLWHDL
jgi:hypothetical protein